MRRICLNTLVLALISFCSLSASVTPPVLLVDDDHGNSYETYYAAAITAAGYTFDCFSVTDESAPTSAMLAPYRCVVWASGDWVVKDWHRIYLMSYLDAGGTLLLSSQELSSIDKVDDFYRLYLHARIPRTVPWATSCYGIDIMEGLDISTSMDGDGAYYNRSAQEIIPILPGVGILQRPSPEYYYYMGVKAETQAFKTVYLTFPFEHIDTPQMRTEVMSRILRWLIGPAGPTEVASIAAAKARSHGESVRLPERVVYASLSDAFYIQDPDRSSGIMVVTTDPPEKGTRVIVTGDLDLQSGEPRIVSTSIEANGPGEVPVPMFMVNRSAGKDHSGLSNIGLHVTVCGRVVSKVDDYIVLDDGTGGSGIRVDCRLLDASPNEDDYVAASGACSYESISGGTATIIRPSEDLRIYPQ